MKMINSVISGARSIVRFVMICAFSLSVASGAAIAEEAQTLSTEIVEPVTVNNKTYHPVNFTNVTSLFWKLGVHKPNDISAINQFALIKNCHVYDEYYNNDFMWGRIKASQRRQIKYFTDEYPVRFVLDSVVELSRFDFDHNTFYLNSQSSFDNMGIINLFNRGNMALNNCNDYRLKKDLPKFPVNISLQLLNPMNILSFPLDASKARKLIDGFSKNNNGERILYSRIYFNVLDVGEADVAGGFFDYVRFMGRAERFEIYSDIEATDLIYSKDFR